MIFAQLLNSLSWWQWLVLATVPPAIIALYFLKLKRRPVEVPSTYLWHKSIEDLHVNSIWQRLRRNLLLFLQLLLILLCVLALLRPGWRGMELVGNRFIFLVDNSASMQADDVESSRLEEAKRRIHELIDQMDSGDAAMIVSFADTARVEQMFEDNRRQLRRSLDNIKPTRRGTLLDEALQVSSGLANPGRSAYETGDVQVAEALPATMFIASDGKFPPVPDFDPGNLEPVYLPVGNPLAENVAIVAFSMRRHELRPGELQGFARVENLGSTEATVSCEVRLNGQLVNADRFKIPAGEAESFDFPLQGADSGVVHLAIDADDHFALDNEAWAVVHVPRQIDVLLVTPGNRLLESALSTEFAVTLADAEVVSPDFVSTDEYRRRAAAGEFDLVIFDRCRPQQMPQANTFFIAELPPGDFWAAKEQVAAPDIIDTDPSHPLMQWVELGLVLIDAGTPLEVPAGGSVLIDSHVGPMLAVAPREGFEDAVLGFPLIFEKTDQSGGGRYFGTSWPFRPSFYVFFVNLLEYLGGARQSLAAESIRPGEPIELDSPSPDKPLGVRTPSGKTIRLEKSQRGKFRFAGTSELGIYEVRFEGKMLRQFAVNLFDRAESDIVPSSQIRLPVPVVGQTSGWESTRQEIWKWLLILGLAVLCFEWYVYNRRVYL